MIDEDITTLTGSCKANLDDRGNWTFSYSGANWDQEKQGFDFSNQPSPLTFTLGLVDESGTGRLSFDSDGMKLVKDKDAPDQGKWKKAKDFGPPFSNVSVSAGAITFTNANDDGATFKFCCEFDDSANPGKKVKDDPTIINKGTNS